MPSVASAGATDRMMARTVFKAVRAGSLGPRRYSSTSWAPVLGFLAGPRLRDFVFFMRVIPGGCGFEVYAGPRSPLERFQDLARSVGPRASGQARAGMGAAAAKIEVVDRRAIAGPVEQRTHGEELIERKIAMKDLATG